MNTTVPWMAGLLALDDFEFFAFWAGAFLFVVSLGFMIDWIMKKSAYGPAINAVAAIGGAYIGLYVRYRFFPGHDNYEPTLTATSAIAASLGALLLMGYARRKGF